MLFKIEPIPGMIDNIPKRGSIWYLTDIDYVLYKADLHFNHMYMYTANVQDIHLSLW